MASVDTEIRLPATLIQCEMQSLLVTCTPLSFQGKNMMQNTDKTRYHVALGLGGAFLTGALILLVVGMIDGLTGAHRSTAPTLVGLVVGGAFALAYLLLGPLFKWFYSGDSDALNDPESDCSPATRSANHNGLPCYCEEDFSVRLRQPVNTMSALAFVLSAALVLFIVQDQSPAAAAVRNPMQNASSIYPVLYGVIVLFMGPASMFLHASMRSWGGWLDNFSIVIWLLFNMMYSIVAVAVPGDLEAPLTIGVFLAIFIGLCIGLGVLGLAVPHSRDVMVAAGGGLWGIWEFVLIAVQLGGSPIGMVFREGWWFVAGFVIVIVALVLNILSGGPALFGKEANYALCFDKMSWAQVHGLWHILAAIGTFLTYMYFRSQLAM
jgi:hypothetical protein